MRPILTILLAIAVAGALYYYLARSDVESAGLPVGQPAPDFTAQTVDGQTVHLADLRGKVVVLDFWATWCPPCRAMIPHEREMVKRLAGKPFVLLGISADDDLEDLRRFLAAEGMTWPNIQDGPGGPIGKLYNVAFYPTVYVLDGRGVVRYKHVRDRELEQAVEGLLAEGPG
jgi:peroxiredoxin